MSDRYLRILLRQAQQGIVPLQDYVAAALRVSPPEEVIADLQGFSVEDIRLALRLAWIPVYAGISKETKARVALAIALEAGETDFPDYTLFEQNQSLLSDSDWRLFAADCAERVLHYYEADYPHDIRPRTAIAVARRFARGEATLQESNTARAAAWSAAGSATRTAAESAASYAARSAAESAASYAARSAAMSAAWSAAWFVAESAARNAAWSAAWFVAESAARNAAWSATQQAEIAWQTSRLSDYLVDLSALPPPPT